MKTPDCAAEQALADWAKAYERNHSRWHPKPREVKLYDVCKKLGLTSQTEPSQ